VNAMLTIEFVHAIRIKEDQCDKGIDRALLREPEPELIAPDPYVVQLFYKDDSEEIRHNKPDDEADRHELQVRLPIVLIL
jgi:hypothetical protein